VADLGEARQLLRDVWSGVDGAAVSDGIPVRTPERETS
jgi:hypothetical protein